MPHNGPAVEGVNVGGAVRRFESWYFSQKIVPAGKPPWRNFCKSRRKIKLSRLQDLSRAEVTNLADEWKVKCHDKTVKVARKNCDKFITPTVRVSTSMLLFYLTDEFLKHRNILMDRFPDNSNIDT